MPDFTLERTFARSSIGGKFSISSLLSKFDVGVLGKSGGLRLRLAICFRARFFLAF